VEEKLTLSPLSFAFVGDAYMSLVIRRMLLEKGDMPVNKFHKASVKYVSADAQAAVHDALLEKDFLTEEEKEVMHRGKNHAHPTGRGANYSSYKRATGLESLLGFLYMTGKIERADEIIRFGVEYVEGSE
jgi:ribonuclease-3 family protein